MVKSRILWILWILLTWIYWFFADSYSGLVLAVASILIPLVYGILIAVASKKIEVQVQAETIAGKNCFLQGSLHIKNKSLVPMDRIVCTVRCENMMTGEVFFKSVRMGVTGKMAANSDYAFSSAHCGRFRIAVPRITVYDPFGIFRFHRVTSGEIRTLVRPDTFPVEVQIVYGESMSPDSEEFSMKKAGFDPSETFAIREYVPGDRIKQIHWKLSEKMGNLMIREYGLPIQNTILLLLETGLSQEQENADPDCLDTLAEGIVSLAQELVQQQIIYSIGWYDHEEKVFACVEINAQEELTVVIPELLGTVPGKDERSILGHYLERHEQCEFAHVVIFSPHPIADVAVLENQCLIKEIICEKGDRYMDESNMIQGITPDTAGEDLAYMEI